MDNAEPIRLFPKKEEKKADEKKEAEVRETEAKEAEEAEEKEADEEKSEEEGKKELTPEEEKQVSGGFGGFPRVPDYDYDDSVKGKV